ncbi:uncharacterized protein DUF1801 [Herbihabitans rhizosphaerae]|uniref:Uncharacterized protein DUF1801 n=1 Tax=Herbihabitans rhizosphaerae TaxID=1872711 RepID=A0A4Q7KHA3_9PSEU|nr:DUF1801 domain-containing protein [Herbihabitans rhizosphaerae]RZS34280.1 uncharacterized protein DUF1801 [Herbihabitans rhizosphaerae]
MRRLLLGEEADHVRTEQCAHPRGVHRRVGGAPAQGDWALVSLASNKRYISLYVCSVTPDGRYLPESYEQTLGKVSVGRSCIRFSRLSDVDTRVLATLLREAATLPPADLRD